MSTPLRVAVNLTWLAPGRVGGSEQYLTRQLAGLPLEPGATPELYVQPPFATAHPALVERFRTVAMPFPRDWRAVRIAAEHSWLPVRARDVDIVHHGGGTVPFTGSHPVLLTVHDLQYRQFPHYFSPARLAYLRRMMPRSARRATMIATPSAYVRGTVIDAFGTDPDRVVVVTHGVPPHAPPDAEQLRIVTERHGLADRPFVIYPAITHPHKGHRLLVDMLGHLDSDHMLVLLGGAGAAERDVDAAIDAAGVAHRVIRPGRVSDAERDALVAAAAALVFPSEYEGFGAPLVEAMMLGTPVVCGDHPAMREVVGAAGVVVTDRSGEAWAAGVRAAVAAADELTVAGHARAAAYTLERSGEALAAAYQTVASIGPAG
jgi:glycosyltransferase involved in cell wall biosynthesis